MLAGEFPAQQGHSTIGREGQHLGLLLHGQDQSGRGGMVALLDRLIQVQAAQQLGAEHLHGPIGLDQQAAVRRQGRQSLLALQLGVGPLRRRALGHQFVAALHQPGAPGGGEALFEALQLGHHGVQQHAALIEQMAQPGALFAQIFGLLAQTLLLQPGESAQGHGQHRVGLALAQVEVYLQAGPGAGGIAGLLDHRDHPAQIREGLEQTLHHLQAVLAALEGMAGAPDQGVFPVVEEFLQQLAQAELAGLAVHQGQQDGPEVALQGRAALQVGQHLLGIGIPAQLHHHPHPLAVGFVADVGDAADLAVVHLLGQLLDPARLAQLVRQLGDHHRAAAVAALAGLYLLDVGHAPHRDAAAAAEIGVAHAAAHQHFAAGGEVGPGHQLQQLLVGEIRSADQGDQGVDDLAEVMGGDAGGHAHRNAAAAVEQQEGQLGRQHGGFLLGAVEVGGEVNGVVADFLQQPAVGDRRQAGFRVAHRRRWVVVHRAEVAVAIQQRVTAGEGLHQPYQGVVDRLVAVGVVLAEHVAYHASALAVRAVRGEPQLVHGVEDPPLHRFEAVAHIRQRPSHDHAHRVFEVRALHLLMQGDRLHPQVVRLVCSSLLGHPVLGTEGAIWRSAY